MTENWRDGLHAEVSYKRKFAILPTKLNDDTKVWLKPYYRKFVSYCSEYGGDSDQYYRHTDAIENVSEETFVVRKLSENL